MGKKESAEKQQYRDGIHFIAEWMDDANHLKKIYSYAQRLMWEEGTYGGSAPETKGQTGGIR